jgi:cytochrome c oxidase cbb3-type subunit 3
MHMSAPRNEQLLDHEYDGIREYDNPTPGWWNWLFALTVVFSVAYAMYYHLGTISTTIQQDWEAHQVAEYKRIFGKLGVMQPSEATILAMMADEQMLAVAKGMFGSNCAACHAKDGGGINGPNMTDDHYKNVRTLEDVFQVITKGAGSGAMPAWEQRLGVNERIILAAYAASLRGTTPATAKAPEGEVAAPWPAADAGAEAN